MAEFQSIWFSRNLEKTIRYSTDKTDKSPERPDTDTSVSFVSAIADTFPAESPVCLECGKPLDSQTARKLGRHVWHLTDDEWQHWLVTGYQDWSPQ